MAERKDRMGKYRQLAERVRRLAEAAQFPETRAELLAMAQSYHRLSQDSGLTRIVEGYGAVANLDAASNDDAERSPDRAQSGLP